MKAPAPTSPRTSEQGGITILVVLMMLVLLTVSAIGMSRNSMRDIMVAATARQGAMARNQADTGLDWSVYWLAPANLDTNGNDAVPGSKLFAQTIRTLISDVSTAGLKVSLAPVITSPASSSHTDSFALDVTRMGKLESPGNDQKLVMDWRLWPDIWAIRSNAKVDYGHGLSFANSKEAWLSTPVRP